MPIKKIGGSVGERGEIIVRRKDPYSESTETDRIALNWQKVVRGPELPEAR